MRVPRSSDIDSSVPASSIQPVIDLARAAGTELLARFRESARLGVERKGPRDLVTQADHASEACILNELRSRYPSDRFLAEESGVSGGSDESFDPSCGRVWIIDPLDGTTNFAHGHPLFSVSIALWIDGRAEQAVVYAPVLDEMYWAEREAGAYRNGQRLQVADTVDLSDALLATGFSYARTEVDAGGLDVFRAMLLGSREVRRGGSACLDLAHTAAGVFAGFWEFHLQPHDLAAGVLLVEEAGGVVTDARGGDDFLFGGSLVAGAAPIHTALLEHLREGPAHPGA